MSSLSNVLLTVDVQDLVCDGVSHCGHGQDEDVTNNCAGQGNSSVWFMPTAFWFMTTAV
jgi:hypothetical protein